MSEFRIVGILPLVGDVFRAGTNAGVKHVASELRIRYLVRTTEHRLSEQRFANRTGLVPSHHHETGDAARPVSKGRSRRLPSPFVEARETKLTPQTRNGWTVGVHAARDVCSQGALES